MCFLSFDIKIFLITIHCLILNILLPVDFEFVKVVYI